MKCPICKTEHIFESRRAEWKARDAHGGWPIGTRITSFSSGVSGDVNYHSKVMLPEDVVQ